MSEGAYADIAPDTKNWTWVLEAPCPECGYDASTVVVSALSDRFRLNAAHWRRILTRPDEYVRRRPEVSTWSPLEYACHVRDVHQVFRTRVIQMLETDDPEFPNWDQDATARELRYDAQVPTTVSVELAGAADALADTFASMGETDWDRHGRRSDGSVFTVASIGRYCLHDVEHHLHDVDR